MTLQGKTFCLETSVFIHNLVFPISPEKVLFYFLWCVVFLTIRRQVDVNVNYIVD